MSPTQATEETDGGRLRPSEEARGREGYEYALIHQEKGKL